MREIDKTAGFMNGRMMEDPSERGKGPGDKTGAGLRFSEGEEADAVCTDPVNKAPVCTDPVNKAPSCTDPVNKDSSCTDPQREVAEKVHSIIAENPEMHITVRELSQILHVSATQIKVCFRKVYGVPVYTYTRRLRMEMAAELLAATDESILEIAGKCGYENGSKFARAFKDVKGIAPGKYRRQIRWEQENQVNGQNGS